MATNGIITEYNLEDFQNLAGDLFDMVSTLKDDLNEMDEDDFNLTEADYLSFYKGIEAIYAHKPEV